MEEVASGLKPEASVTEIQMSRRWGRMAFKVKGINGLYKGPEMKMCVTVGGGPKTSNVAGKLIKPRISQHPERRGVEESLKSFILQESLMIRT